MWSTVCFVFSALLYFWIHKYSFMKEIQKLKEIPLPILEFIGYEYQRSAIITLIYTVVFLVVFNVVRKIWPPRKTKELTSPEDSF